MPVRLTIDGKEAEVPEGSTVLEAAHRAGSDIPTLCYHRDLAPVGSCRLCIVEVDGVQGLPTACTLPAVAGMVVRTETPAIRQSRRAILELLVDGYHDAKYTPSDRAPTEFERCLARLGVSPAESAGPRYPIDSDPNPVVWVDLNKCILCTRCVRACEEVQGRFVWGVAQRGEDTRIVAGADTTMLEARCESCGACAAYCPTGALDDKPSIRVSRPDRLVTTTCPYCGVGCRFDLNVKEGRIVRVTSNPSAPVNGMSLCVKGRYGYEFVHHPDRLTVPKVRRYLLEGTTRGADRGEWVPVDWPTALNITAHRLHRIRRQFGPNALGFLASAKCTNEENYLVGKLARQVIGTHNVDHCARLCHASTVAGLALCFGSGAMSNTMDDVAEQSKAFFVIGSNTTEQHPVFGARIRQAVLRRGVPLMVADPRRIDLAEFATLHLRQRPGTDVALLNGIMHVVLERGWHDRQFIQQRCEEFEEFAASLAPYTPPAVAEITGVPATDLYRAAEILAQSHPMAAIWSMGITQHTSGVLNVLALGNLQMLLGNMGVPGGGVNPLRGQNNVQGACDMGALPNVLPGYQTVTDAAVRERFESAWRLEPTSAGAEAEPVRIGAVPGCTVTEMIDRAGDGTIRGLFILGENPAMTDPDLNHARDRLARCEFLVLEEIFESETAQFADVLLPGASWAEKQGTFTNTERRIQTVHQAIEPIGQSRPDWAILADLARRLLALQGQGPVGPWARWDYQGPAEILDEIGALTPPYAGVNSRRLEQGEQLFWPVPRLDHPGTPILHVDGFSRGKGRFHVAHHLPAAELPDEQFPMILTTGRVLYHWHGTQMTRRVHSLLSLYPESLVEISPEDAARIGLVDQGPVRLVSRRGEATARVLVTDRVSPGIVFGNFHFPAQQNINNLTIAALDPLAKIPEYKVCAVRLESAPSGHPEPAG